MTYSTWRTAYDAFGIAAQNPSFSPISDNNNKKNGTRTRKRPRSHQVVQNNTTQKLKYIYIILMLQQSHDVKSHRAWCHITQSLMSHHTDWCHTTRKSNYVAVHDMNQNHLTTKITTSNNSNSDDEEALCTTMISHYRIRSNRSTDRARRLPEWNTRRHKEQE